MKSALLIGFFMFLCSFAFPQLENTKWVHSLDGKEHYIEFQSDSMVLGIDGESETMLILPYKIRYDSLFIYNTSRTSYCKNEEAALYTLSFTDINENMHIKGLIDPCFERNAFLSSVSWKPKITKPEEDLNYVVIRIYMDRIEVEGERNPQALYITDIQGKQVLSAHRQNHVDLEYLSSGNYILQVWDQGQLQWVKTFYWE